MWILFGCIDLRLKKKCPSQRFEEEWTGVSRGMWAYWVLGMRKSKYTLHWKQYHGESGFRSMSPGWWEEVQQRGTNKWSESRWKWPSVGWETHRKQRHSRWNYFVRFVSTLTEKGYDGASLSLVQQFWGTHCWSRCGDAQTLEQQGRWL